MQVMIYGIFNASRVVGFGEFLVGDCVGHLACCSTRRALAEGFPGAFRPRTGLCFVSVLGGLLKWI